MTVCESRRPNAGSAKLWTPSALSGYAFVPKDCLQEASAAARTIGFQEQLSAAARTKTPSARAALRTQDARLRTHRCRSAADLACAAEVTDAAAARRKGFELNQMSDLCACWWPFGRRDSNRGSDGGWSPSPLIQARTKPINIVQGSPLVEQACRKASFAALYDLGPEIGSGSTSTVHKSTQKASGKVFATKVVSAAGLQTPGVADQFASEVLALKRCRHPHVVSLEDAVVDENKLYLVTELLTGGELFDYVVKRGTLGEDEAASILSDVGDAIRFMHDQGASRGVRIDSKSP